MSLFTTLLHTLQAYIKYARVTIHATTTNRNTRASDKASISILAWSFAPDVNGGVYRPAALARYASEAGYRVTVFAGSAPTNPTLAGKNLLDHVGSNVKIVRVEPSAPPPSYRLFPKLDGGLHSALDLFFAARAHFGDSPPDVIVATGPPFHVFVAGYWLARTFGCRLVLDYRDEWTLSLYDFVTSKGDSDQRWEARCLQQADQVILTTRSFQENLCARYPVPGLSSKCQVVPNGWDPPGDPAPGHVDKAAEGKLVIMHAGTLGEPTRVGPFLRTLEQLIGAEPGLRQRLLLRFVGQKRDGEDAVLAGFKYPEMIDSVPVVPQPEAARLLRTADILLLLVDKRCIRTRPGRLYEYLAAGKPILICEDSGETTRVVDELKAGWSIKTGDTHALRSVITRVEEGNIPRADKVREDWLQAHSREALSKRMLSIIADIP